MFCEVVILKKKRKILLRILAVILILIAVAIAAVFLIFGKDNVIAAIKGLTTSTENIEQKIHDTEKEQVEMLNEHGMFLTKEDLDKINSGELVDEDEIVNKLLGTDSHEKIPEAEDEPEDVPVDGENDKVSDSPDTNKVQEEKPGTDKTSEEKDTGKQSSDQNKAEKDTQSVKPDKTQTNENKDTPKKEESTVVEKNSGEKTESQTVKSEQETDKSSESTAVDSTTQATDEVDKQIASLVAKMYVYKSQYTSQISSLVGAMSYEFYHTFPPEEQTYANKMPIYNKYSAKIAQMEAQCDAQVATLISDLKTLLIENGRDVSLADSLLAAYNTEKENSKAYHISRFAD